MLKKISLILLGILLLQGILKSQTNNQTVSKNYSIEEKNGIKEITSKNKASQENLEIDLEEVFSISPLDSDNDENGVISPSTYEVDSKENIFFYDRSGTTIVKFDSKGQFIKRFGKKGNGPGEYVTSSHHMIVNDNIIVCDQVSRKLVFFDNNGEFIENVSPTPNFPITLASVGDDQYLGLNTYQDQRDGKAYFGFSLTLVDKDYKAIKKLWISETEITADLGEKVGEMVKQIPMQSITGSKIFLAGKSKTEYQIEVYDFNGKLIEVIKKKYRRVARTKQEIKDAGSGGEVQMVSLDESGDVASVSNEEIKNKYKYKDSILGLNIDKEGRIWVNTSKDSKKFDNESFSYYDIFSKNGIFLKTIKLDKEIVEIKLVGDKMYAFYGEDSILKVYNY